MSMTVEALAEQVANLATVVTALQAAVTSQTALVETVRLHDEQTMKRHEHMQQQMEILQGCALALLCPSNPPQIEIAMGGSGGATISGLIN